MDSRLSWVAGLSIALGVMIAIKSCDSGEVARTVPAESSPPTVVDVVPPSQDERNADELSEPLSEDQAHNDPTIHANPLALEDVAATPAPSTRQFAHAPAVGSFGGPLSSDPGFVKTAQNFELESKDQTWSDAAEAHILARLSQMTALETVYVGVDCRTTMCRIQVAPSRFPPSRSSFQELASTFGSSAWLFRDGTGSTYVDRDALNSLETIRE